MTQPATSDTVIGEISVDHSQRLLIAINDAWFLASHRLEVVQAAIDAGYEVHIAAVKDASLERFERMGCFCHHWNIAPRSTHPLREVAAIWSIFRIMHKVNPDCVHLITLKALLYGGMAARLLRVPAVVFAFAGMGNMFTKSGTREKFIRHFSRALFRFILGHPNSHVIVQNEEDRQFFLTNRLLDAERITKTGGSGVNLDEFQVMPAPTDSPVCVLLASRMLWSKGIQYFVDAADLIHDTHPQVRFLLAGRVDEHNTDCVPLARLEQWHRQGIIEWLGLIDDMPDLMTRVHIVCLPTFYGEGLPKVLIEAGASARPVICTDWRGCSELVIHEHNGLLIPPRDVNALVTALQELIGDRTRREELGRQGRARVEANFSVDSVVEATLGIYARLLANVANQG